MILPWPQLQSLWGFPGGPVGKKYACSTGDVGLIPGLGRSPGEGHGNPPPVFLPGKSHGQSSLAMELQRVGCKGAHTHILIIQHHRGKNMIINVDFPSFGKAFRKKKMKTEKW